MLNIICGLFFIAITLGKICYASGAGFLFIHDSPVEDSTSWSYTLTSDDVCLYRHQNYQHTKYYPDKKVESSKCYGHHVARKIKERFGACTPTEGYPSVIDENRVRKVIIDSDCLCLIEESVSSIDKELDYSPLFSSPSPLSTYNAYYGGIEECLPHFPIEQREEISKFIEVNNF